MLTLSIIRTSRIMRIIRRASCAFSIASLGLLAASPGAIAQTCQPAWAPGFDLTFDQAPAIGNPGLGGFSNTVSALTVFDDGTGPALYAGGGFTTAGGVTVNGIAKWDGSAWSPLANGMDGPVIALTVFDDGAGPALYAGGSFGTAGSVSASKIAKWNGSAWSPLGSGVSSGGSFAQVGALTVFDDGTGPALYAGGSFTTAGGVAAGNIAKWDGASWSTVGGGVGGVNSPFVNALSVFDDGTGPALYVGGRFVVFTILGETSNNIAKWDGSTWSLLANGMDGPVIALTVFDDGTGPALYAGGSFGTAGSVSASKIAKWNGSSWSALGTGVAGSSSVLLPATGVSGLTVFDDGSGPALYMGGLFSTVGGVSVSNIAKWNGLSWSPLGSGIGGFDGSAVFALTVFDDWMGPALYAGGRAFTTAGGALANDIAKWNGVSWLDANPGSADNSVNTLKTVTTPSGTELFAIGPFLRTGGAVSRGVGRFDGLQWRTLGGGVSIGGSVNDLAVFNDGAGAAVYAGGSFTSVGGVSASNIAKWNGVSWSPLGTGINSGVNALAVFDDGTGPALYAGCDFFNAGGVPVNRIAKWDGQAWSALGQLGGGVGGAVVNDLAVFDDGTGPALYVAGSFTSAGGDPAIAHLAKWDGSAWSAVGSGVNGTVTALDVLNDGTGPALWVRGGFSMAGGQAAVRIARWDGTQWNTLGGGLINFSGVVDDLAVFDDGSGPAVYATGAFSLIGNVVINRIAKWNGLSWSGLGPIGLNNEGKTLAVFNDGNGPALFVGGTFTEAGGLAARHVARWDGLSWSVLDLGIDGVGGLGGAVVNALAIFDGPTGPALYAGGSFDSSGGLPASNFARWNGCAAATNPADFNGDGAVNAADLATLLVNWGPCPPPPAVCAADLNSDGAVNAADLATLLVNWG